MRVILFKIGKLSNFFTIMNLKKEKKNYLKYYKLKSSKTPIITLISFNTFNLEFRYNTKSSVYL